MEGRTFPIKEATVDILDTIEDLHTQRGKIMEDVIKIPLEGSIDKYLQIRSSLQESWESDLIDFFKKNLDDFAWTPFDMREIIHM